MYINVYMFTWTAYTLTVGRNFVLTCFSFTFAFSLVVVVTRRRAEATITYHLERLINERSFSIDLHLPRLDLFLSYFLLQAAQGQLFVLSTLVSSRSIYIYLYVRMIFLPQTFSFLHGPTRHYLRTTTRGLSRARCSSLLPSLVFNSILAQHVTRAFVWVSVHTHMQIYIYLQLKDSVTEEGCFRHGCAQHAVFGAHAALFNGKRIGESVSN